MAVRSRTASFVWRCAVPRGFIFFFSLQSPVVLSQSFTIPGIVGRGGCTCCGMKGPEGKLYDELKTRIGGDEVMEEFEPLKVSNDRCACLPCQEKNWTVLEKNTV